MIRTRATCWCLAVLAAGVALIVVYYCSTLVLVSLTSPQPPAATFVFAFSAQMLFCSLACFFAGRAGFRRLGAACNSTQQPTSAPSGARG
jgi:hypothetical protein